MRVGCRRAKGEWDLQNRPLKLWQLGANVWGCCCTCLRLNREEVGAQGKGHRRPVPVPLCSCAYVPLYRCLCALCAPVALDPLCSYTPVPLCLCASHSAPSLGCLWATS